MFDFDATVLARIQFAFTISFHIIFPAITIGLATYLAVLEGLWLKTANEVYQQLYQFWSKIFAINFGMGVVSGIVMAYQFGTHWSAFSAFAGSVTGPLLTYEVLTAFFLEAGFLGGHAIWSAEGRQKPAFLRHLYGRHGHDYLNFLDLSFKQLDADAPRF
jgi:cytochrome d ubiquinol oxidase subunit I